MLRCNLLIISGLRLGAANGARTRDPELGKLMLYQLSYCRICVCLSVKALVSDVELL